MGYAQNIQYDYAFASYHPTLSNIIQDMAQTSQSPFNERDAGLLMVFADPGKEATEAEFHGK